jgi:hypothetical protein
MAASVVGAAVEGATLGDCVVGSVVVGARDGCGAMVGSDVTMGVGL